MMLKLRLGKVIFPLVLVLLFHIVGFAQSVNVPEEIVLSSQSVARLNMHDTAAVNKAISIAGLLGGPFPDSSIKLLRALYDRCMSAAFARGAGRACANIGKIYTFQGNSVEANRYITRALYYPVFNRRELRSLINNLGVVKEDLGDYVQAMRCYQRAIQIMGNNTTDHHAPYTYMNISALLIKLSRYKEASFYLNKFEMAAKRLHDNDMLAASLLNKILVAEKLKQYDSAMAYSRQCLTLTPPGDSALLCAVYTDLGDVYSAEKEFDSSICYFDKAAPLLPALMVSNQLNYYQSRGFALLQAGRYKDAKRTLEKAQEIAAQLGIADIQDIKLSLADAYLHIGNYKKAAYQYKATINLKDSIQDEKMQKSIAENEVRFRTAEKDKDLLAKQLQLQRQQSLLLKKNIWLICISLLAMLAAMISLNIYRVARHRRMAQQHDIEILKQQATIDSLQASIEAENKERQRIGRELHDGISGMLTAINMNISGIQQRHRSLPAMRELDTIIKMLQNTAVEVRKTAHNLIPDYLLQHDFEEVLQAFAARINAGRQLQLSVCCYSNFTCLDKSFLMLIYRIIQELVQNIVKHAAASSAEVQVRRHNNLLCITVEDNGKGFDVQTIKNGIGLQQINSRIATLKGFISIDSVPLQGTTVYIEFDLAETTKILTHGH